eukprot:103126_1
MYSYNDYKIICESLNACDKMTLKEKGINVTMIMFQYSEHITIINDIGFSPENIICGSPSETNTINFDIYDYVIDPQEIYTQAQSFYQLNKFPCHDIVFQCIEPFESDFCEISYEFITPSSLLPIDDTSGVSCYDININYLQNIVCDLTCDNGQQNDINYYSFDITFNYQMEFTENSSFNESNINHLCAEYFGDKATTQFSLNRIDDIFEISLSLFTFTDHINSIQISPETTLLSNEDLDQNKLFSDCLMENNEFISVITLRTYFEITVINETGIKTLFAQNSYFYNQTVDLLFDYFVFSKIRFFR